MPELQRVSVLTWIGLVAAGAMVIGAFGPWVKAVGLLNVSVSGTDGSNDGWVVVGVALLGVLAFALYERARRGRAAIQLLWSGAAALAGGAGAAVAIYDRGNVTDAAEENTSELATLGVGWGLNLVLGGSIVLAIVGAIAFFAGLDRDEATVAVGTLPPTESEAVGGTPRASEPVHSQTAELADDISRLAELHSRGVLTDEEFRLAKQRALSGSDSA
jgi:hypothetical protein